MRCTYMISTNSGCCTTSLMQRVVPTVRPIFFNDFSFIFKIWHSLRNSRADNSTNFKAFQQVVPLDKWAVRLTHISISNNGTIVDTLQHNATVFQGGRNKIASILKKYIFLIYPSVNTFSSCYRSYRPSTRVLAQCPIINFQGSQVP